MHDRVYTARPRNHLALRYRPECFSRSLFISRDG
jgi:hypothetical protein